MQDTNKKIIAGTTSDAESNSQINSGKKSSTTARRSRYAQRSGKAATNPVVNEPIGEIQLAPGETLTDDLIANSDVARAQSERKGPDSSKNKPSRRDHDGRDRGHARNRRGRGDGASEGEHGAKHQSDDRQEDKSKNRQARSREDRGRQERRDRGKSSGRGNRSSGRGVDRRGNSDEIKPATWNAAESDDTESIFDKIGAFFASIFGGFKPKPKPKPKFSESHRHKRSHGKGKRRRSRGRSRGRSGGGGRGGQK
jgi:hypothetical protein